MTTRLRHRPLTLGAVFLGTAGLLAGCAGTETAVVEPVTTTTTAVPTTTVVLTTTVGVSDAIAADLIFLREEERLAGDVYEAMYDMYGLKTFSNIAESEDRHTESVLGLLDSYGIDDPAIGLAAGEYSDPVLQNLYDELMALGSQSLADALTVGATIEDLDIVDLRERVSGIDEIDTVLANLEKGSMNHLAAFVGQLERRGETYTAQYLTQAEVDAIVAA
jgi:hypothetical protein